MKSLFAIAMLCLVLMGLASPGRAAETAVRREDQLKAAYLLNFMKFVEWPATVPMDVLTICFIGGEGIRDALASGIENKHVGARRSIVRRLQESGAAAGCNVLYLDEAAASEDKSAVPAPQASVLTVSDAKGFTRNGGMIELFMESNRTRFIINVENAKRAGLNIGSGLLQLAAAVEKEPSVSRTRARFDANRSPRPDKYYPPISQRLGEEGAVIVDVCIGPDGRIVGPAKLDGTSGSSRLDEAALKYAVHTLWTPATENGKPVQACIPLSVRFVLKDRY